jgi:hypothetical protein
VTYLVDILIRTLGEVPIDLKQKICKKKKEDKIQIQLYKSMNLLPTVTHPSEVKNNASANIH